jgi:hypothetical protein
MKRFFSILLCIILLSSLTAAYAEEASALQILGYHQDGSILDVILYTNGESSLMVDDISIEINGTDVPVQKMIPLSRSGNYGTSWIIIVEPPAYDSISAAVASLVESLASGLGENDNLAVINGVTGDITEFVRDVKTIMPFVNSALTNNGTVRLYDNVRLAMDSFASNPVVNKHKCLLLISEGVDANSSTTLSAAKDEIENLMATVYCVGITRGVDTYREAFNDLQALSQSTASGLAFSYDDFPQSTGTAAADRIRENEKYCFVASADLSGFQDAKAADAALLVSLEADNDIQDHVEHIDIEINSPHDHIWEEATCTQPKTCSECGETEGEPVDHQYGDDGLCIWCGEPANPVLYWVKTHLILCVMAGILVLLLIVLLIVLIRKRRLRRRKVVDNTGDTIPVSVTRPAAKVSIELTNKQTGQKYVGNIYNSTIKAGRTAEMMLPGDASISHEHMEFVWQNGILYVQDSNSRNGTWVNGSRINGAVPLNQSDIIHAGDSDFIVNWHGNR